MDPRKLYIPLTAGTRNPTYIEKPPCEALAPYVRCYWYQEEISEKYDSLVIPDTCVDIIFAVGEGGVADATFCGVNDRPYYNHISNTLLERKKFAVRFYAWGYISAWLQRPVAPSEEVQELPRDNSIGSEGARTRNEGCCTDHMSHADMSHLFYTIFRNRCTLNVKS